MKELEQAHTMHPKSYARKKGPPGRTLIFLPEYAGEQVEGFHWSKFQHEQTIITEVMAIILGLVMAYR